MSFVEALSPDWIEAQYLLWKHSPDSVSSEWRSFFTGFDLGREGGGGPPLNEEAVRQAQLRQSGVQSLIYRFRDLGHLLACTDPLNPCPLSHPYLDLSAFGLSDADLDTVFSNQRFLKTSATLREILATMKETYCRYLGVEFMHIQDPEERQWLIDRMEPTRNLPDLSPEYRLHILRHLQEAALFEEFLHRKFIGQKRFSLEGGETVIPLLDEVILGGARLGVRNVMIGMAHRGRLNVLANIFHKPLENIFAEFADNQEFHIVGEGDVKYHKGYSIVQEIDGARVRLSLAFNPSHLEIVNPVVEGRARARQERIGDTARTRVMPVLLHGDAAFAGQGVVAETLNLSQLEGYATGGTIHIIINNQIGFTTLPKDSRSTPYSTDVARMLMAPIFHCHGEEPESAIQAVRLAVAYRQQFHRDVVIEMTCYRRYGHNEGDEPFFTQPMMYEKIKDRPSVHKIYAERLREMGIAEETITSMATEYTERLNNAMGKRAEPVAIGFKDLWAGMQREYTPTAEATGEERERLIQLSERLATLPDGFSPHPKIGQLYQRRLNAVTSGQGLDWGNAETLAYATLLCNGVPVRLSGQDSRRGTFNHRHATLHDLKTGSAFEPLTTVCREGSTFQVFDSMLSEAAVLGFEYGYSLENPQSLTIWEAQFGDFANGAQVVIDQFIAAGESKWDRSSGLVMLLPHGYEGQGAEHSSARIERYLQLCALNNMFVAYPSTPAQMFHLLRRQVMLPFRKPLVVFTPKSLLRHPACVSSLDDLAEGSFQEVIPAPETGKTIKTLLISTGKIYYDLLERQQRDNRDDVAIVRVEQLYPLRFDSLKEALGSGMPSTRFIWVQEEPKNMGAWNYIRPYLNRTIGREVGYVGRAEEAAPAVGSHRVHKQEQDRIVEEAFS